MNRGKRKASEERSRKTIVLRGNTWIAGEEYLKLISEIKNHKLHSPSRRAHLESVVVPVWLRNSLREVGEKLPREMYLIDCGYFSCVYEYGPYAIKLPRALREILKSSNNNPRYSAWI